MKWSVLQRAIICSSPWTRHRQCIVEAQYYRIEIVSYNWREQYTNTFSMFSATYLVIVVQYSKIRLLSLCLQFRSSWIILWMMWVWQITWCWMKFNSRINLTQIDNIDCHHIKNVPHKIFMIYHTLSLAGCVCVMQLNTFSIKFQAIPWQQSKSIVIKVTHCTCISCSGRCEGHEGGKEHCVFT